MAAGIGGGISAGDAVWTITGDSTPLQQSLAQAEGAVTASTSNVAASMRNIGQGMAVAGAGATAMGALITGALGGTLKSWADAGSAIQDMSTRTGVATETLSKLKYVGELADVSFEEMGNAFKFMGRNLDEATTSGTGPAADALTRLGLSITDIAMMNPEQQFLAIAGAIGQVESANTRTALSMDIFGRSGSSLLTIMMQGKDAIAAQMAEAEKLGLVYDTEGAASAEAFGDSLDTLNAAMRGVVISIGPMIAQIVEDLVPAITSAVAGIQKWVSENEPLVLGLIKWGGGIGIVLTALGPLLIALGSFLMAGSAIIGAVGSIAGALGGLGAIFSAAATGVAAAAAAIAAPVTLAAVAVGLAVSAVIANWEGIKEGLDVIWDAIKWAAGGVVDFLGGVWDGIVGVFTAGWDWISGILAQIADAVGGLFGGIGEMLGLTGGTIEARASGGPVNSGQPYLVGEEGPELFVPQSNGSIVPNGGTAGGISVNINMGGVSVRNDSDIRTLSERIAELTTRQLRAAGAFA